MSIAELQQRYAAWGAADRAWTAAMQKAFPKKWPGDVRYSSQGQGEAGTPLRAAYEAHRAAQMAFYAVGGADWLEGKSAGQIAYEKDVRLHPNYHTGERRRAWHQLGAAVQDNWERAPTWSPGDYTMDDKHREEIANTGDT